MVTVSGITTDSDKTLEELGVITESSMCHLKILSTGITATGAYSEYTVYKSSSGTYYVTPIFEGNHVASARISSDGILTRYGGTASVAMKIFVSK